MKPKPHFTALLRLLPTDSSGKTTPWSSGFRAALRFPDTFRDIIGIFDFGEEALVFPGDSVTAEITLADNPDFVSQVYQGLDFDLFESDILIGSAVITQFLS